MPFLSRQTSPARNGSPESSTHQSSHRAPTKQRHVTFIPAQIDGLCGTSPSHSTQNPLQILMADVRAITRNIICIPAMLLSMCSAKVLQKLFGSAAATRDTSILCLLAISQIAMLFLAMPMFIILPGIASSAIMAAAWAIIGALLYPLRGPRIVLSSRDLSARDFLPHPSISSDFSDERWIFVNSTSVSNRSLKHTLDRLSRTFHRRITAVHNAPCGLFVDMLLLFFQRACNLPTPCTLALTGMLRDACLDSSVRKVVLISHGTGAVAVSCALDRLHGDLPVGVISKMEVYSFGSAAGHLSNPALKMETIGGNGSGMDGSGAGVGGVAAMDKYTRPNGSIASPVKAALGSMGHRVEDRERVIPHVEHYAYAGDWFARIGVLGSIKEKLDARFCGRLFVLDDSKLLYPATSNIWFNSMDGRMWNMSWMGVMGAMGKLMGSGGGFLFEEHYLDVLFPENANANSNMAQHGSYWYDALDSVVEVDIAIAVKREFTAQGVALPLKAANSYSNVPLMGSLNRMMYGDGNGNGNGMNHSPNVSPRVRGKKEGASYNHTTSPTGSVDGSKNSSRHSSGGSISHMGNGKSEKRRSWGTAETMGVDCVGRAKAAARECEGRTVRQLSRLWRFRGGGKVVGEGVPFANGVGAGY